MGETYIFFDYCHHSIFPKNLSENGIPFTSCQYILVFHVFCVRIYKFRSCPCLCWLCRMYLLCYIKWHCEIFHPNDHARINSIIKNIAFYNNLYPIDFISLNLIHIIFSIRLLTAPLALREADESVMMVVRTDRSCLKSSSLSSPAPICTHSSTRQYAACACSSPFPLFKHLSSPSWIVNFLKDDSYMWLCQ